LIRYDVLAVRENRDLFHHLLVYDCPESLEVNSLEGVECGPVPASDTINQCLGSSIIISWVFILYFDLINRKLLNWS
jgi:hypothetical protein